MRVLEIPLRPGGPGRGGGVLTCYIRDNLQFERRRLRPAVIICPGGAYAVCAEREGEPYALRFLDMGCQTFVLRYSVAPARFPQALLELAEAVAAVRERAGEWGVDPSRILVCGSSAGGHLAGCLGVHWDKGFVQSGAGRTGAEIRPDGLILCYPVVTMGRGEGAHQGSVDNLLGERREDDGLRELLSLERQAGPQVPPVFLWNTLEDGTVPPENSLLLAGALMRAGVSVEYHLFPLGRHALALADETTALSSLPEGESPEGAKTGEYMDPAAAMWTELAALWIRRLSRLTFRQIHTKMLD